MLWLNSEFFWALGLVLVVQFDPDLDALGLCTRSRPAAT